jgi:hypothetical protein
MVGLMLIISFMLGEAGISRLEMPEQAMNLNIMDKPSCRVLVFTFLQYTAVTFSFELSSKAMKGSC